MAEMYSVETGAVELEAEFLDFDDYWTPFLAGYGPASHYLLGLPVPAREHLRERLRGELSPHGQAPFRLPIRALSVRGIT
jgi:hypothetical protein